MKKRVISLSFDPCSVIAVTCRYDKLRDIEKVLQGQAINLVDALKNGKIPPIELPDTENGLISPDDITGRLQDSFDAADLARRSFGRRAQHEANKAAKLAAQQQQQQQQQQTSA